MAVPQIEALVNLTLSERLTRTNAPDLQRWASMDQATLGDLRTKTPTVDALPQASAEA